MKSKPKRFQLGSPTLLGRMSLVGLVWRMSRPSTSLPISSFFWYRGKCSTSGFDGHLIMSGAHLLAWCTLLVSNEFLGSFTEGERNRNTAVIHVILYKPWVSYRFFIVWVFRFLRIFCSFVSLVVLLSFLAAWATGTAAALGKAIAAKDAGCGEINVDFFWAFFCRLDFQMLSVYKVVSSLRCRICRKTWTIRKLLGNEPPGFLRATEPLRAKTWVWPLACWRKAKEASAVSVRVSNRSRHHLSIVNVSNFLRWICFRALWASKSTRGIEEALCEGLPIESF